MIRRPWVGRLNRRPREAAHEAAALAYPEAANDTAALGRTVQPAAPGLGAPGLGALDLAALAYPAALVWLTMTAAPGPMAPGRTVQPAALYRPALPAPKIINY